MRKRLVVISTALGAAIALLATSGLASRLDWKAYDRYLSLSPVKPAPEDFLVVEQPEGAEATAAKDSLAVMRLVDELGARSLVLVGPAYAGQADSESLESLRERLPSVVDEETAGAESSARALFGAIRSGSVKPKELGGYIDELGRIIRQGGERIKAASGAGRSPVLDGIDAELARLSPVEAEQLPRAESSAPDADGIVRRITLHQEGDGAAKASARQRLLAWPRPKSRNAPRELPLEALLAAVRDEEELAATLAGAEAASSLTDDGAALPSRYRNAQRLGDEALAERSAPQGQDGGGSAPHDLSADWREARSAFFASAADYFAQAPDSGDAAALALRLKVERERLAGYLSGSRVFIAFVDRGPSPKDSFAHRAGAAYREAVIASTLASPASPRETPKGLVILISLLLIAAVGAFAYLASPAIALAAGSGLAIAASLLSLLAFSLTGAFATPIPLFLGPLAVGALSFALSRARPWKEPRRARLAIAACEAPGLLRAIEALGPDEAGAALAAYRRAIREAVSANAGKMVTGGGTRLIAYFEEKRTAKPAAARALEASRAALASSGAADMRIGLDEGDCLLEGGAPVGAAADLASRLADLCMHYGCRALAAGSIAAMDGTAAARLSAPKRIGEIEVEATGRKTEIFSIA